MLPPPLEFIGDAASWIYHSLPVRQPNLTVAAKKVLAARLRGLYTSAKTPNPNLKNPNPYPRFYQVKLENYGINVTPDKNSSRKLRTSRHNRIQYNLLHINNLNEQTVTA